MKLKKIFLRLRSTAILIASIYSLVKFIVKGIFTKKPNVDSDYLDDIEKNLPENYRID